MLNDRACRLDSGWKSSPSLKNYMNRAKFLPLIPPTVSVSTHTQRYTVCAQGGDYISAFLIVLTINLVKSWRELDEMLTIILFSVI